MLPSPMQLFSSVTTVQVEHPPPPPPPPEALLEHEEAAALEQQQQQQEQQQQRHHPETITPRPANLMHPKEAIYTRTTSAKKISTNEFKVTINTLLVRLSVRPKKLIKIKTNFQRTFGHLCRAS